MNGNFGHLGNRQFPASVGSADDIRQREAMAASGVGGGALRLSLLVSVVVVHVEILGLHGRERGSMAQSQVS